MKQQTPSLSWGHININVSNLDQSIAFYQKLGFSVLLPGIPYLGLTATPELTRMPASAARALDVPEQNEGRACIMQLDDGFPKIDLTEWSSAKQQRPPHNADLGLVRLCLASQDLAADYAMLVEQGVAFLSAPQGMQDGKADIAVCIDPDGALIELIQLYLDKW
ncbi:MAG: VOC family protein [Halioglobus sp.]